MYPKVIKVICNEIYQDEERIIEIRKMDGRLLALYNIHTGEEKSDGLDSL